jgi:uncharacterized repeat protein (TIGR01451 family)
VTKTDAPDPVETGDQVTYTMVVTNNGPDTAADVVVTDPLPAEVTYVSHTTTKGTCVAGPPFSCTLGSLAPNESVTITVVVTANQVGTVTNEVTVTTTTTETNTTNNRATTTTTVQGPFVPPVACARVTVTPRTLAIGKRSVLRVRVVGDNGRGMRRARVTVRGLGINVSGRTNATGVVRLTIRPRRTGVVQIRVTGQAGCAARLGVIGVFRPPLTG